MSEASKTGLLKRMHADGADTFAKKVKWVTKHIPTIDDPQAYVGWLTREERSTMATRKRNPTAEEHYDYGKRKLQQAKVELEAIGPKGEALTGKLRLSSLWVAYRLAVMAENELHEGMNAKDTLKLITEAGKIQKQAQQAIEAHLKGSKAKNPMTKRELFGVLGVNRDSSEAQINKARRAKKASGHNYVVCDSHGKAIALTTTLAEARKTVPKGGCIEKI